MASRDMLYHLCSIAECLGGRGWRKEGAKSADVIIIGFGEEW